MAYVVRFRDKDQEHELRAATIDAAEAIVRFLSNANVPSVTVEEDEREPSGDASRR